MDLCKCRYGIGVINYWFLIKTGQLLSRWWDVYFRVLSAIFQGKWSDTFPSCVFSPRTAASIISLIFKHSKVISYTVLLYNI